LVDLSSPNYFSPYSKELMQSEIPLNFILQKTNQLKNNRQKKRMDKEIEVKQSLKDLRLNESKSKTRNGTREKIPDDAIYKIITGGK
jgi:hypothetical protein